MTSPGATPASLTVDRDGDWIVGTIRGSADVATATGFFPVFSVAARKRGIRAGLLDVTDLRVTFREFDRYFFGSMASQVWPPLPLAVLGREPVIDPSRFGELVARNRGMNVRAFTDRAEALRWLEGVAPKNGATPSW